MPCLCPAGVGLSKTWIKTVTQAAHPAPYQNSFHFPLLLGEISFLVLARQRNPAFPKRLCCSISTYLRYNHIGPMRCGSTSYFMMLWALRKQLLPQSPGEVPLKYFQLPGSLGVFLIPGIWDFQQGLCCAFFLLSSWKIAGSRFSWGQPSNWAWRCLK